MGDREAVIAANEAFYRSLEALDIRAMRKIWAQRTDDICVHPGWEVLHGWHEIEASWTAIFANTGYMRFQASDVSVEVLGDVGRVTCVENIYSVIGSEAIHSRVASTNLFLREGERWKLFLHHGSPIASVGDDEDEDGDEEIADGEIN